MAEQLSFSLEAALPHPGDVAPMWPVPLREPFDSDAFLFEPTWGGHRVLVYVEPGVVPGTGEVRIVDPNGLELASRIPELAGMAVRVAARSAVLDAELVVVDALGRADDEALRERLAGRPGRPVACLVFDLLHVDGRWLLRQPLEKRRAALRRVLRPGDEVVVVPAIPGEGRALHAAVSAQGIAGILARRRTSPYLPGVRSRLWRAIPAAPMEGMQEASADVDADATVGAGAEPGMGAEAAARPPEDVPVEATGTAPVFALFRRLPFAEEPDDEG
jgi:bifunctional non-homologous end joining protein LigD